MNAAVPEGEQPLARPAGIAQRYASRAEFRWVYPYEYVVYPYLLVGWVCAQQYGFWINWRVAFDLSHDGVIVGNAALFTLAALIAHYLVRRLRGEDRAEILADQRTWVLGYAQQWRDWRRWLELLRALLAIKITILVYTHLKQAIPLIHPLLYDDALWSLDAALHLGVSPSELSVKLLGSPLSSRLFDLLYVVWYLLTPPFLVFFVFFASAHRSWQFLTNYVALWAFGGLGAILVPSLGPIYTHPELFESVSMPIANGLQLGLWENYQALLSDPARHKVVIYDGIAAFPSLHVGMVALFAAAAFRVRWLFKLLLGYLVVTEIGSVLLGWHYAIDGYVSCVIVATLWLGTRPLFREPAEEPAAEPPTEPAAEGN